MPIGLDPNEELEVDVSAITPDHEETCPQERTSSRHESSSETTSCSPSQTEEYPRPKRHWAQKMGEIVPEHIGLDHSGPGSLNSDSNEPPAPQEGKGSSSNFNSASTDSSSNDVLNRFPDRRGVYRHSISEILRTRSEPCRTFRCQELIDEHLKDWLADHSYTLKTYFASQEKRSLPKYLDDDNRLFSRVRLAQIQENESELLLSDQDSRKRRRISSSSSLPSFNEFLKKRTTSSSKRRFSSELPLQRVTPSLDLPLRRVTSSFDLPLQRVTSSLDLPQKRASSSLELPLKRVTSPPDLQPKRTSPSLDLPPTNTSPSLDLPPKTTSTSLDQQTTRMSPSLDLPAKTTSPSLDQPPKTTSPSLDQPPKTTSQSLDLPAKRTSPSLDQQPTRTTSSLDVHLPRKRTPPSLDLPPKTTSPSLDQPPKRKLVSPPPYHHLLQKKRARTGDFRRRPRSISNNTETIRAPKNPYKVPVKYYVPPAPQEGDPDYRYPFYPPSKDPLGLWPYVQVITFRR